SEQEQALLVRRRTEGASVQDMCNEFGIAKATYYRYVHKLVAVDTKNHYGLQKSEATPLGEGAEQ
ncbi:helix-turn-helix domain-containing protein, partial [Stenotrophomonas maltophilia]